MNLGHMRPARTTLLGVTVLGLAIAGVSPAIAQQARPVSNPKITICHRTNSTSNPYVKIEIDESAADGINGNGNGPGDHFLEHTGPIWDSSMRNSDDWGDIIPPITGTHAGLNWDTDGQAIWNADCDAPSLTGGGSSGGNGGNGGSGGSGGSGSGSGNGGNGNGNGNGNGGNGNGGSGSGGGNKISICHRTNATKNPYVFITVSTAAADGIDGNGGGNGDHYGNVEHQGPIWDPTQPNGGDWGDIIPPLEGVHDGRNWTDEGRAIWNARCDAAGVANGDVPTGPTVDPKTPVKPAANTVRAGKIQICHRTNATKNPYVLIAIDESAADGIGGRGDHFNEHTGPIWDASQPNGGDWGDIIPPIAGIHDGLNWDTTGQALWLQGCVGHVLGDSDNDGTPDAVDPDDDNDGTPDTKDTDDDGDGTPDTKDKDRNGDGSPDREIKDHDKDGVPDATDPDDDNDGTPDTKDRDRDNDGTPDAQDPDSDGDGTPDVVDPDKDNDGTPDVVDPDDDNDGTPDSKDNDDDGDGTPDTTDPDTPEEVTPPSSPDPDTDTDGTPDSTDPDDDNDGIIDSEDPDSNGDGQYERRRTVSPTPTKRSVAAGARLVLGPQRLRASSGARVTVTATCTATTVTRMAPAGDSTLACVAHVKKVNGKLVLRVTGAPKATVTLHYWAPAAGDYRPLTSAVKVHVG